MIIKKINIISFGGLKNFSLDLREGLNCIYGDNENGKTTVMAFIKMMFYGNEHGGTQISKNMRKKYTPWDGSPMAGSVEFSCNGTNYRLEREFRTSNSTDKVSLTNMDAGEKEAVNSEIGVRFFGISAAAFERSIFIGQPSFPGSDAQAESEINERLSNMVSTGDEMISFDAVTTRLNKARYAVISKSGRTGEYYRNLNETEELKKMLDASVRANELYMDSSQKLAEYSAKTETLAGEAAALKNKIAREQDIKNYRKIKDLLKTKEELEEVRSQLKLKDGGHADENYLRKITFCASQLNNTITKIEEKKAQKKILEDNIKLFLSAGTQNIDKQSMETELAGLKQEYNAVQTEINAIKKMNSEFSQNTAKKSSPVLRVAASMQILGILLLCSAAAAIFAARSALWIPLCGIGAVLLTAGFIFKICGNRRAADILKKTAAAEENLRQKTEYGENLNKEIMSLDSRLKAYEIAENSNAELIDDQKNKFDDLNGEINKLEASKSEQQKKLDALFDNINCDRTGKSSDEILNILNEKFGHLKELKQHINILLNDLDGISYESARKKLAELETGNMDISENFDALKKLYDEAVEKIAQRREKQASIKSELDSLLKGVENPEILKRKLAEKTALAGSQKAFCDAADTAAEVLRESFIQLRSDFGSKLEKQAAEIFKGLTAGKYSNMTISSSFKINLQESKMPISRDAEYLSSGTVDQAYLSLRLAVAELMSENTSLPVFLDDALSQFDDRRALTAIKFLTKFSEKNQILLFTCHKSITAFAGAAGMPISSLPEK